MDAQPQGLARTAQIVGFLFKHRAAGVFTGLDVPVEGAPNDSEGDIGPEAFVADLEALGPTFVKIGQALSTRPDMVPPDYLEALQRMQDDVQPLPFPVVRDAVEASLGARLGKVFTEFEEMPLGAASIGQVHAATLRDGRRVAVKVQRPGIATTIQADLEALAALAAKADRFTDLGRRVHFADWVSEFGKTLLRELDYNIEAENLQRFHDHLQAYPTLFVPRPAWDLTRNNVLTMELVDGIKVTNVGGLRRTEASLGELAGALMRGYLDQMFIHGEIHADPHPGNVLLTHDGRLALLDLGMVAHVPPRRRDQLLKLLFAAVDGRGEDVAQDVIAMGTRLEDFDEERFIREIGQRVARYATASARSNQSEGRLVLDVTVLATSCGLRVPPELSLLGKTLLNLEAVSLALDPHLDVKRVVEEHLDHVMRERMRKSLSLAHLASEAMEVQSLVRGAPRKVSDILGLLAENRMQVRLTGLEESRLMENLQKIANRISAGIITASLILGSVMLMRVETDSRLFGYPALALVMFLLAAALGVAIVGSALLRDRRAQPREERGLR